MGQQVVERGAYPNLRQFAQRGRQPLPWKCGHRHKSSIGMIDQQIVNLMTVRAIERNVDDRPNRTHIGTAATTASVPPERSARAIAATISIACTISSIGISTARRRVIAS